MWCLASALVFYYVGSRLTRKQPNAVVRSNYLFSVVLLLKKLDVTKTTLTFNF